MTTGRVKHATIVVDRTYAVTPAYAFDAWGDADAHRLWHVPGEGWIVFESERDLVEGGRDYCLFGPPGEPIYRSDGRFEVIAPDRLVVSAGTMFARGLPTSTTLCTVEFAPDGHRRTRLTVTDQSAYFDALHDPSLREEGWRIILEKFASLLIGKTHPAA